MRKLHGAMQRGNPAVRVRIPSCLTQSRGGVMFTIPQTSREARPFGAPHGVGGGNERGSEQSIPRGRVCVLQPLWYGGGSHGSGILHRRIPDRRRERGG